MKKRDRDSQLKRRKGTNKKERVEEEEKEEEEERREEREKEGRERDRQRQRHRDRQRASITLCHIKWEDVHTTTKNKQQQQKSLSYSLWGLLLSPDVEGSAVLAAGWETGRTPLASLLALRDRLPDPVLFKLNTNRGTRRFFLSKKKDTEQKHDQICMLHLSSIGRFSDAGLLEWMRFVIFRERSRERSQRTSGPISE